MDLGTMLLAQTTTTTTAPAKGETLAYACRDRDSTLCHWTWNATSNVDASHWVDMFSVVLRVLLIIVVAWLVLRIVRRLIRNTVKGLQGDEVQRRLSNIRRRTPRALQQTAQHSTLRRAQRAETIGALLRSASTVIVCVVSFLAILKLFDFNLAPILAGAGVATAALGFGAQNIVRDFLAGFFIVVEDQYGVGDVIDVGDASGGVESVSLRITRLRAADGTLWHVPNGEIKRVGNMSQQWSRAVIEFKIAVNSDIGNAIKVIKAEADDLWRDSAYAGIVLEEPDIWGPEEVGGGGILLKLAVKTKPLEQWQISRTLRSRVKRALDANGIEMAPPPGIWDPAQSTAAPTNKDDSK